MSDASPSTGKVKTHKDFFSLQKEIYAWQWTNEPEGEQAFWERIFLPEGEIEDEKGNTPFMVAVWSGKLYEAKVLLDHGADPWHRNHAGLTVFQSLIRDISKFGAAKIASVLRHFEQSIVFSDDKLTFERKQKKLPQWVEHIMNHTPPSYEPIGPDYQTIIHFVSSHYTFGQLEQFRSKVKRPASLAQSQFWQEYAAKMSKKDLDEAIEATGVLNEKMTSKSIKKM